MAFIVCSIVTGNTAYAEDKDKKTNHQQESCANLGTIPEILACLKNAAKNSLSAGSLDAVAKAIRLAIDAVAGETNARQNADTILQNQINSFFDIFVKLDNVADKQCPLGQVATGTNLDGSLICTDMTQNQDCDDGFYMSGIDTNGKIKCKPLPSGSNSPICGNGIVELPEQCDLGISNGGTSSCSTTCTIQTTDLCLGVNPDDGNQCTIDTCNSGTGTTTHTNSPTGTACNTSGGDSCDGAGSCIATLECTTDLDCNDDLFCTTDRCVNNQCVNHLTPACIEP